MRIECRAMLDGLSMEINRLTVRATTASVPSPLERRSRLEDLKAALVLMQEWTDGALTNLATLEQAQEEPREIALH